jgi:non-ribosomal peptide synthetase component F
MSLLAVFGVLLSRHAGQDDVVIGAPISNRDDPQLRDLIGFFVNTLALRLRLRAEDPFERVLEHVRRTTLGAYRHRHIPFERLVETLAPRRSVQAMPLLQVMFLLDAGDAPPLTLLHLRTSRVGTVIDRPQFDLKVTVAVEANRAVVSWRYNQDLFDAWRIEQMARHYERLLTAFADDPGCQVGAAPLLTPEERAQMLVG